MSWQEEFDAAMRALTIISEPIEYRLHYDLGGNIVQCTMQKHPEGTEYIVVDKETYNSYAKYRVNIEKKRLIKIDINPGVSVQLKRSSQGYAAIKGHAGILLENDEVYDNVEYYESNN